MNAIKKLIEYTYIINVFVSNLMIILNFKMRDITLDFGMLLTFKKRQIW